MLEFNINILDVNQTIMQEFFTMMMVLDCKDMKGSFEDIHKALADEGKRLGVDIKIQREEIFKSMHTL